MAGVNIARGEGQKKRAVDVAGPSKPPAAPARPTRWCSHDLKGPLLRSTTQALVVAIRSLPAHWPWPEVDDEAWWQHVLADRRLRRSTAKTLSDEDDAPGQRLDHLPVKSLTFSCAWCGPRATLTVVQLIQMFRARPQRPLDRAACGRMQEKSGAPRRPGMPDHLSGLA